jgi:hypothetical protein
MLDSLKLRYPLFGDELMNVLWSNVIFGADWRFLPHICGLPEPVEKRIVVW